MKSSAKLDKIQRMSDKFKGNMALLITSIVWGSGFIAQKLGGEAMPPLAFNATRQLMAAIALLPLAAFSVSSSGYFSKEKNTESQIRYKKNRMILAGIVCGGCLVLGSDLQQLGLQTVSAGKSGFISATYVVFVPLLNSLFGERAGKKPILCALLALFGFAVMSLKFDGSMTQGDWLTLLSAVGFSAQMLAVSHFVDKDNSILLTVLQMACCGLFGLAFAIPVETPSLADFHNALPILLYTTFIPTCIGYTGQVVGQRYVGSTMAALILSLEAVFAAIFGSILLREVMSVREIIGSAIIFIAVILGQLEKKPPNEILDEGSGIELEEPEE